MTRMDTYWCSNPEWYDYADDDEGDPYLTDKAPEEARISFANFLKQKEENEKRLGYRRTDSPIRITDQIVAGKYTVLVLDTDIPLTAFHSVLIEGTLYKPTIPYDLTKSIAIHAAGDFVGKGISFV